MTRTSGRRPFTAAATPDSRPPPPTGTKTADSSSSASTISSPTVPAPAMICAVIERRHDGVAVRRGFGLGAHRRSSDVRPAKITSAPYRRVPSTFTRGAVSGMTTTARIPSSWALSATACP